MRTLLFVLLLSATASSHLDARAQTTGAAKVEVHFSGQAMATRVRELVAGARHRIWLVAYSLSDVAFIEALETKARDAAFDLRILVDGPRFRDLTRSKANKDREAAKRMRALTRAKRVSQVTVGRKGGLLHIKLMLIDDRILVAGSQNWSNLGGAAQRNDVVVIHDASGALIKAARKTFVGIRDRGWASDGALKMAKLAAPTTAYKARVTIWDVLPPSLGGPQPEAGEDPPEPRARAALRARILRARRVWVAMFVFTDHELGELLVARARARRDVRVVVDRVQYDNLKRRKGASAESLQKSLALLRSWKRLRVSSGATLHHKLAILDDTVTTGSANWTRAAFGKNAEFVLSIALDKAGRKAYSDYYTELWNGASR